LPQIKAYVDAATGNGDASFYVPAGLCFLAVLLLNGLGPTNQMGRGKPSVRKDPIST
jgi:hypothetical protein